ncbi:phosphoribosyltransferase [Mesorhizobium sp. M1C.F.Ca.ET.193.01.1.1]|uniref:phosphoribosyltransferase n=1 Tax=unclassified Mesorhizobium TaxID=325217 RepID=UPI000FD1C381|nr:MULTISPECIES: phosphoribosyltransferase family protein [unclassified Mesorhizobium]TGS92244.1 phosphoribosyltransferase [bacterium M00.F.Ca.ET.177.01.1.1]TGQ50133.1 phosphoribosyltransferase [Mesorhizobium sp. M1C.F.Ca.ET.210.01.1.1]TGQ64824.1 phosphoribosyltransferase [Mesorhizobium sp. M1C.F.Ca.ET.212.01.1.1]TGQ98605.1 phosphoribosyltransferase [Mesorhizobium sp. M1C.F.Ca.ET.204.01.1.1]TGR18846.1 phosphoribosyltransferase [Mesorhizobium sp. M1C.F.Ca.ET.196.01.1.1]
MFRDRQEAGQRLALELAKLTLQDPVVLALPRGGVPVASEVAKVLKAPLDLILVRKVGAPGNPELAVAAIVDGDPADVVLNREIVEAYSLGDDELRVLIARERPELERRRTAYRGGHAPLSVDGKTVIVVDDGAATGTTMKVAIRALKRRSPRKVVVAVPVAPADTATELAQEADLLICPSQPARFRALSYYYAKFPQVSDGEVLDIMALAAQAQGSGHKANDRRRSAAHAANKSRPIAGS